MISNSRVWSLLHIMKQIAFGALTDNLQNIFAIGIFFAAHASTQVSDAEWKHVLELLERTKTILSSASSPILARRLSAALLGLPHPFWTASPLVLRYRIS